MKVRCSSENRAAGFTAIAALAVVLLSSAGCYQRVTRATGPGTENIEVHQRSDEGSIFDGLFGPEKPKDPYGRDSK